MGSPLPAAAGGAGAVWASATVRNPSGDSLVSGPVDAGSWNNGGAGVHRVGVGEYQVTFYGAQENGSTTDIALVSPMGGTARTCAVAGWERVTSSVVVTVKCQTLDGTPVDSRFTVHWLAAAGLGGRLGHTIAGITTRTAPPTVKVSCFDGDGALTDSRFTLAYSR